ncbi:globin [Krasilnikovia sp. M28-CT-15]|uniref:globin n=1 Tax=Krasilnikovia sp. M28-CT-15 TaxID=3373540 RepID=UPI00399CF64A
MHPDWFITAYPLGAPRAGVSGSGSAALPGSGSAALPGSGSAALPGSGSAALPALPAGSGSAALPALPAGSSPQGPAGLPAVPRPPLLAAPLPPTGALPVVPGSGDVRGMAGGGLQPIGRPFPSPPPPSAPEPAPAGSVSPNPGGVYAESQPLQPGSAPIIVPPGRTAAASLDGMDPADEAALREVQRLLGTSLTEAGGVPEVAARLQAALRQATPNLLATLPGGPLSQREQIAQALTWLVGHLDDPPALVAGCTELGSALAQCGVTLPAPQLVGAALAEAMRAGLAGAWRQDFDQAWRGTWQHAHDWIAHGMATSGYAPITWRAVVVEHELRRPDLAVVRVRPYLPMPYRPGQFARIEVAELPGVWRPYSLSGAPRRDTIVELHVRAKTHAGVSGTLVHRTSPGDHIRLAAAEGAMGVPTDNRSDLLLVAGDTGVAPLKALLIELAATNDPRSAVLFWGARTLAELYDIDEITEIAHSCRRATVVPVISEGDPGPYASGLVTDAIAAYGEWSAHEVFLAGPPIMLEATSAALRQLGVAPERIHHDAAE